MSVASKITLSREEIRNRLVNELAERIDVKSEKLSAEQGTFTAYMLDAISAIGADILFYSASIYRESTLVTALLPETVRNWARYIDYTPKAAQPAEVVALMKIPLQDYFVANIYKDHNFYASGIPFRPKYEYMVKYVPDAILVTSTDDTATNPVPYSIEPLPQNPSIQAIIFPMTLWQIQTEEEIFAVERPKPLEYFRKEIILEEDQQIVSVRVFVNEDGINEEEWPQKNILTLGNDEKGFEAQILKNQLTLIFGNGMYGRQVRGTVRVEITTTLGSKGNIISGTLNSGEPLYSEETTLGTQEIQQQIINYLISNPEEATNGEDSETIEEIKRNAPTSLSMLHRIVSEDDYKATPLIITGDDKRISKPILKRSDLAVNDIDLFLVLNYHDEVVPTDTIAVEDDGHTDYYKAFHIFQHDGKEWYCPFQLDIFREESKVRYTYIKPNFMIQPSKQFEDPSNTHVLGKAIGSYDYDSETHNIKVYLIIGNDNYNYTQTITLQFTDSQNGLSPTSVEYLQNKRIIIFSYDNIVGIKNIKRLLINTYEDGVLKSIYSAEPKIASDITDFSRSAVRTIEGTKYVLDVPVILKEWVDNLVSIDNQGSPDFSNRDEFIKQMIEDFVTRINDYKTRMMNTAVLAKFARTHGNIENFKKSVTDFYVELIANSSSDIPHEAAKYFALSDPVDESDPLYDYAGNLIIWDGTDYKPIDVPISTTISVGDNLEYRITDGRRWLDPHFELPLEILVQVHLRRVDEKLIDTLKRDIYEYINTRGIEGSIYLSKITDILHNHPDVKFVRILKPTVDIIYKDIIKNMNKKDLVFYTPEYIWTTTDHIKIRSFVE